MPQEERVEVIFFKKKFRIFKFFQKLSRWILKFDQKFLAVFEKLQSTCLDERFEEK